MVLSVVALVVALAAAVLAVLALLQVSAGRRRPTASGAAGETPGRGVAVDRRIDQLTARVDGLTPHVAAALRHVAVVRYDAFGDSAGRLSFSAALLDDAGDGLVITSIHARDESRTYAKGVIGGRSDVTLTPEERQAVAAARTKRKDA